jgi:hypothetical protein
LQAALAGHIKSGESLLLDSASSGSTRLANPDGGLMLYDEHGRVVDHVTWSRDDVKLAGEGVAVVLSQG